MALQTSGPISLGDLRSQYGDSGSSSLSEFYRGGSRVVSSVTVQNGPYTGYNTTYETESESDYNNGSDSSRPQTFGYKSTRYVKYYILWKGSYAWYVSYDFDSVTTGGWTYYMGSYQYSVSTNFDIYGPVTRTRQVAVQTPYTYYTTSNEARNTNVPTSGAISLGNFYGGTN